jgi:poly-beta-1,6-N-acetyl-D-glucosamine synthase
MIVLSISILLFVVYGLLIVYYRQSWIVIPDFTAAEKGDTKISVIIPARNEEEYIGTLLSALQHQFYSAALFEVIVIDDHSTDKTASIVQQYHFAKLIQLKEEDINSYKKKAIETGIAAATGELIVTTDADCIPPTDWLQTIASFYKKTNAAFIAAPVVIDCGLSAVQIFQSLDFMVLQGITGASVYKKIHSMCNGANLAYEKKVFYEVGGFEGIDNIASGDDMLLMHKIWKKYPDRVHYLKSKDAIVSTQPVNSWAAFFNQRIRWASKADKYDDKRIFAVLLLVYLFNVSLLILPIAAIFIHSSFSITYYWLLLLGAKTIVELLFLYPVAEFFNKTKLLWLFPLFQPLHILYTVIAGFLGKFGSYSWKGRKVK